MNYRITNFESLSRHPFYSGLVRKLTRNDVNVCVEFLNRTIDLSNDDYEMKVNRMFMDKVKPKNWAIIQELLSCSK